MPQKALARRLGMAGARAVLPEEAAFGAAGGTQGQQQQSENRGQASKHALILADRRPGGDPAAAAGKKMERGRGFISGQGRHSSEIAECA